MATLPDGRVMLFGGSDTQGAWFNDLHVFTGDTWSPVTASNVPPSARANHNAWVRNDKMYVQGGLSATPDGKTALKEDLWLLDLQSSNWKQGPKPPGFISPNARPILNGDKAFLVDAHLFDDSGGTFFVFDMKQGSWQKGKLTGEWPRGSRSGYSMVQAGSSAYLLGGQVWDPGAKAMKDSAEFWVMDVNALTWKRLADMPYPFAYGAAVYDPSQGRIIAWGGLQGHKSLLPGNKILAYYLPMSVQ